MIDKELHLRILFVFLLLNIKPAGMYIMEIFIIIPRKWILNVLLSLKFLNLITPLKPQKDGGINLIMLN